MSGPSQVAGAEAGGVGSSGAGSSGAGSSGVAQSGPGARPWIVLIGVMSLFATVGALVFGDQLAPHDASERNSLSEGPLGHRAFVDTLRAMGVEVEVRTRPDWLEGAEPMLFIEPDRGTATIEGREHSLETVLEERLAAGLCSIVILPKWRMVAGEAYRDTELAANMLSALPASAWLSGKSSESEWQRLVTHGALPEFELELREPQYVATGEDAVLLAGDSSGVLLTEFHGGLLVVVSDPDLLHNFNIQRGEHASLWRALLETYSTPSNRVVIDEVFHGMGQSRSLPHLFATWPGYLALVHFVLIVLVVLLMGRQRFGPAAMAPPALGRGPREIIGVAASVLAIGSRPGTLAARYIDALIAESHRRLRLPEDPSLEGKAARIDAYAKARKLPERAVALLARARGLEGQASVQAAMAAAKDAATHRATLLGATRVTLSGASRPSSGLQASSSGLQHPSSGLQHLSSGGRGPGLEHQDPSSSADSSKHVEKRP